MEDIGKRPFDGIESRPEPVTAPVLTAEPGLRMDFTDVQAEWIVVFVGKIPGISGQFSFHIF